MANSKPHPIAKMRLQYERGRLRQAAFDAIPALFLAATAVAVDRSVTNGMLGIALIAVTYFSRWHGRALGRGVGPALLWAWFPLVMPILSTELGTLCFADQCHIVCRAVCITGGLIAGFALANTLGRIGHSLGSWFSAALLIGLAAVAGCQCVGWASLISFSASFGLSAVAGRLFFPVTVPDTL